SHLDAGHDIKTYNSHGYWVRIFTSKYKKMVNKMSNEKSRQVKRTKLEKNTHETIHKYFTAKEERNKSANFYTSYTFILPPKTESKAIQRQASTSSFLEFMRPRIPALLLFSVDRAL
ncbi:hypothetical protein PanWU01x14_023700, partial [Parasponia andersonii]